jgi:tripartite-type tricarboxylate transporter receptor subunit TctC
VRSSKVRALAVTAPQRVKWLPEIPTASEAGLPGFEVVLWNGLFLPAGTPEDIVTKVHGAVSAMVNRPTNELLEKYNQLGMVFPRPESRAAFTEFVRSDLQSWKKRLTDSNVESN